jgi:hypothetical protein
MEVFLFFHAGTAGKERSRHFVFHQEWQRDRDVVEETIIECQGDGVPARNNAFAFHRAYLPQGNHLIMFAEIPELLFELPRCYVPAIDATMIFPYPMIHHDQPFIPGKRTEEEVCPYKKQKLTNNVMKKKFQDLPHGK